MGITKECISAPLESGSSLQDSRKLPSQLGQALDYVSERLMRKHVHLTLIVVKMELTAASTSPALKSPSPSRSSSRSSFSIHLPSLPGTPRSTKRSTSRSSSFSSQSTSPSPSLSRRSTATQEPDPYGLSLHYTSTLPSKTCHVLDESIAKAVKKYSLGSGWLIPPSSTSSSKSTSGFRLTTDLICRSLQQHDIIYGSESLTLLAVDRIYTLKLALSEYSKSFMPAPSPKYNPLSREEKLKKRNQAKMRAMDELRLLVLFQKSRPISQSYLLRSYDHLSISVPALRSVNEAYKTCFHADGVDMDAVRPLIPTSPLLRSSSGKTISSAMIQDMSMKSGVHQVDMGPHQRAPTTPTHYDEVTPITRDEWDALMWGRANVGRVEVC